MGLYLGANVLGGGGGSQPGDLVAINQDGTATNDPTTNFIIDYNGGKYLRTGITIPTVTGSANTYSENILPSMVTPSGTSSGADLQLVGNVAIQTSLSGTVRSTIEITGTAALPKLMTSSSANNFRTYMIPFGGDNTHIYASYENTQTSSKGLYITNKSTGATTVHTFPFGSSIPTTTGGRLSFILGKGLFADKILCIFGNSTTEQGFMAINKSGTVDTSFNAGLFTSGVYRPSSGTTSMYYGAGVNANSKRWNGWMKVNPDAWALASGAADLSGSTSGNATIPSSNTFELRYVTIIGYIYPGGHYYTALDHATGSMRGGIGVSQNQAAMQWTYEDGSAGPSNTGWNDTHYINDTTYAGATPVDFGDLYDTASAAQAALDTLNTANSTSYNSFPKAQMGASTTNGLDINTFTSDGSVESRVVSAYPWSIANISEAVGEPALLGSSGTYYRTRGVLAFDAADNEPSFWAFVRVDAFEKEANPGVTISKLYLVEFPALVAQRTSSITSSGAQGYIRPMYYDIRDKSISYGAAPATTQNGQRTTGVKELRHHTNLVTGDTRSKFKFPIWVKLE
jgi:hypothetical protein